MGFDGVIITDDMNMHAIADIFSVEDAMVKAVLAGVDILLVCSNIEIQHRAWNALLNAVTSGLIGEDLLTDSVRRISGLKCKYGLEL